MCIEELSDFVNGNMTDPKMRGKMCALHGGAGWSRMTLSSQKQDRVCDESNTTVWGTIQPQFLLELLKNNADALGTRFFPYFWAWPQLKSGAHAFHHSDR